MSPRNWQIRHTHLNRADVYQHNFTFCNRIPDYVIVDQHKCRLSSSSFCFDYDTREKTVSFSKPVVGIHRWTQELMFDDKRLAITAAVLSIAIGCDVWFSPAVMRGLRRRGHTRAIASKKKFGCQGAHRAWTNATPSQVRYCTSPRLSRFFHNAKIAIRIIPG